VSTNLPTRTALLACPYGLDQIRATFGDIFRYVLPDHPLDARWQTDFLVRIAFPFALPLSWDKTRTSTQMTCHKSMAGLFTDVFGHLQTFGLQKTITSYGGFFSFPSTFTKRLVGKSNSKDGGGARRLRLSSPRTHNGWI